MLDDIKQKLTFIEKQPRQLPTSYQAFAENADSIRVPKFFKLDRSIAFKYVPAANIGTQVEFSISPEHTLRPIQVDAVKSISERLVTVTGKARGAILCIPCGFGKTRCAIFIMRAIGVATLVLFATKQLGVQFQRALHSLSPDVTSDWLPKPNKALPEVDVLFGTLQAMHSRNYGAAYLNRIGLLVVDEAHHLAAPTFAQAMCRLGSARVLGLTATPERSDGKSRLVEYIAGKISFRKDREPVPDLRVFQLNYEVPAGFGRARYGNLSERMQLIVRLCAIEARNLSISSAIQELSGPDRPSMGILVLGKLIDHLRMLCETASSGGIDCAMFTGSETQAERDRALASRVLFATYDIAKEGLDIPRMDTLVLVTPAESLVQCVGRILRGCPGKQSPVVVDVFDNCCAFQGEVFSRERKFRSMGAHLSKYEKKI